MASKLTKRSENYAKWYQELVTGADLAENSPVRGCMVIKPYGYAIWEKVQAELDRQFKATGHQNAYFPLFIPKSYFTREASHVDGFAKECAVVTHYRLKEGPEGEGIVVDENARLEEELIVRPTSETVIWDTFKGWIQSYRDLPLKINQWANVVRWEMRTRLFLRTAEFLWQEGHTAHTTREEAVEEAELMLKLYGNFVEQYMAIPVVRGVKTASERFAGAVETYCIEALMQDGKALQAGTTHFLGQNFAKAFDVTYASKEGQQEYVWATSWGVSTRLMGALVMTHSDDNGLVLPPYLAPHQVVIVPIYRSAEQLEAVRAAIAPLKEELEKAGIRVHLDDRDTHKPGWKFAEYELKGVPIRLAMGPRDLENGTVELARRDELRKEVVPVAGIAERVEKLLAEIQDRLYQKAAERQAERTHQADDWATFKELIASSAGFVSAHWDGTAETEEAIKNETKATIRCIPLDQKEEAGSCVYSGKPSQVRVLFAKAY